VSASVPLRRKGAHTFKVLARSANGTILPAEPETLTITRALTAAAPPLSKSFGVVIDDGSGAHTVAWLVEKGRALPTRTTKEFKTAVALVPGGELEVIQVHVVEGESNNQRPERTRRVGEITITDREVERAIRAGSPVEVTIEISESRLLTARAYFPVLDRTFDVDHELKHDQVVAADLAREITAERERVTRLAEHIPAATTRDFHDRLREAATDARAAQGGDTEASQRAFRTLQEVQKGVDTLEDALRVPTALAEAREESEMASTVVMDHGDDGHRARLRSLIADLDQAAANGSESDIRRAGEKLGRLRFEILVQQPWFWMGYFRVFATDVHEWTDPGQAQLLIQQGESQLQREDIDGLRSTCNSLRALVKPDDEAQLTRFQNVGIRG
jgi:molecular chaperone DnaK